MRTKGRRWLVGFVVLLTLMIVFTTPAWAAIGMDGEFEDWDDQAHITDPQDAGNDYFDISNFYWGNNSDDENLYFMLERFDGYKNIVVESVIYFDINNNGSYDDAVDRFAVIHYRPHPSKGFVDVEVYPASSRKHSQIIGSYHGDWGAADSDGGLQWEFYVPMSDLDIQMGQSIRMYAFTTDNDGNNNNNDHHDYNIIDRIPDEGDIQWSPIPILGQWGWLFLLVGGLGAAVFILWKRGKLWAG